MLPAKIKKLVCQVSTSDFEKAVQLVSVDLPRPGPNQVLVKNRYVGVNATDINITAGKFYSEKPQLPFDVGFEGLGEIVEVGPGVTGYALGQTVCYICSNAYAEYVCLYTASLLPVPDIKPEYVSLLISGLTAAIGLAKVGEIKKGERVLITAAAGGLGQFCIQLAKQAGCHVIGTCSTNEKADFIRGLGCDDVINYREEDLDKVLKEKYPDGLDVIWETIGGRTFEVLSHHLKVKGRLVIIGGIEGYQSVGFKPVDTSSLPVELLLKSASLRGFLLLSFQEDFGSYFSQLVNLVDSGQLRVRLDEGQSTDGGVFHGIKDVVRAVQHLHSGKSAGKVAVKIS